MSMNSSGLLLLPKRKEIKTENKTNDVVVKQELSAGCIKKEPKTETNSASFLSHRNGLLIPDEKIERKNTSKWQSFKRRSKRKPFQGSKRKNQFATALHVYQNLNDKDPSTLSKKQQSSLTWAEMIILRQNFRGIELQVDDPSLAMDGRDSDEIILIEDDVPDTLQLAVVDFGAPGGRYSVAHGNLIEKALGKAVVTYTLKNLESDRLSFGTANWNDGVIVLDCKNQLSYDFAQSSVGALKLWEGSILRAVPPVKNIFMKKVRLVIPNLEIDTAQVLDVLRSQNPLVNMKSWKVIEDDVSTKSFKEYTLLVEPPVALMQNGVMKLFYGAGEVTLQLIACR